ncbi:histidine phosphatase family protein [Undibacterium sp. Ji49W]|uniref:histidine phosphatase family protein n=1 Tax=Undibacterium sp. Ji49W TaxID=3413040 RepID=UPI003BF4BF0F
MRLHLLRHTKPQIADGLCYGQADVPVLAADYQMLAIEMRQKLSAGIPVFSSPLQRCALLAQALHDQPQLDPRLMEMHFGAWELCAWDAVPRAEIDAWAAAPATYCPGGGESALDVAQRVIAWLTDVRQMQLPEALVVAHAGIMRMLLTWQDGMAADELAQLVCAQNRSLAFGEYIEILVFHK